MLRSCFERTLNPKKLNLKAKISPKSLLGCLIKAIPLVGVEIWLGSYNMDEVQALKSMKPSLGP